MPMKTQQLLPEVLEMDMRKWFKEAQYGMMAHWGLYSLLGGEWNGKKSSSYAEWIQANQRIPMAEYDKLATSFNPVYFNADQWIRLAKECGMKYFVMTSKHHDGFALFHSRADRFNVVDATPFGRDVVGELAEACYKHGLKFGLYYSQDLDWHEEHGGGYLSGHIPCAGQSWCNDWDFPDNEKKNFDICFENKIRPQVEEILRNYGELCLIWFDVPMTIRDSQSRELFDLVKKYQPDCLIHRAGSQWLRRLKAISLRPLRNRRHLKPQLGLLCLGPGLEKRRDHPGHPEEIKRPWH